MKTLNKITFVLLKVFLYLFFMPSIVLTILCYLLPQVNKYFLISAIFCISSLLLFVVSYIINELTEPNK